MISTVTYHVFSFLEYSQNDRLIEQITDWGERGQVQKGGLKGSLRVKEYFLP
jgi:hypothetical protein